MPFAPVNGQQLYYEDTGGNAPAIVFSHGMLMDHTMFAPQIAALRDRYRCIVWDERAHGYTARDTVEAFSYYDSAEDLAALLDHLGIQDAVCVGMSQGGFLTLRCALTHPGRVRALILISTQAGTESSDEIAQYRALFEVWAANGLPEDIADASAQASLGPGVPDVEGWKKKWRGWQPHNLRAACQALTGRDDITGRLGEIAAPALVIHGDADLAIGLDRANTMAAALPECQTITVAGAGHAVNLSHPDLVNAAIADFLAQHV